MGVRILTVCTGNICRSPTAQYVFADRLAGCAVDVQSAGTRPLVGQPVEPAADRLLRRAGIDTDGFAARRLSPALVVEADLVLGMAREHRSTAVQMVPAALRYCFTLRELARLAERIPAAEIDELAGPQASVGTRLRALKQLAPRHRTVVPGHLDDIIDPYRRDDEVFAAVYSEIIDCVDILGRMLAPERAC